ncbi:type III-A CRISPR-associated protein Csm2 [Microcoleus vaginatus GB1-A2]|uniref:type III-A CRISPR-associated protein Csm2 n=1 Tax=Microcoleus vaginatus TaxID=119532 RepID=UPI0032A5F890
MTNPANRPNTRQEQRAIQGQLRNQTDLSADQQMIQTIRSLKDGQLRNYEIRQLVKEAELLGTYLKEQELKTNQIRKFLDAVKRLKVKLAQDKKESFSVIEDELFLLKPKLAYAAVRQQDRRSNPVKPLSDVISEAIDKVKDSPDFYRLVQLIESIIAYHKAAGGKDN